MPSPALVIMAAGIGSRYGGLKQIDPVGPSGEIVIDYSMYDAIRAGFSKIVFIVRRDIEKPFREKVGRAVEKRVDTDYVFQDLDFLPPGFAVPPGRAKPWGTAHAVLCCKKRIKTPFAVINADDFYGAGAFRLLADFLREAGERDGVMDACLIGYVLKNTLSEHGKVARGVCRAGAGGLLESITELTTIERRDGEIGCAENGGTWAALDPDCLVSMNCWGYTPGLFTELESRFPLFLKKNINSPKAEFYLSTVTGEIVRDRRARVRILPTKEKWYGITYPQDKPGVLQSVRGLVDAGLYPENLWK